MNETLRELMAFALDIPAEAVGPSTSPENTPAWDSMRNLLMLSLLEQEFAADFTSQERDSMVDAGTIEALLHAKGAL